MKYFFDTEFIEGFHKPAFGKRRHFIDLISIGIVAEDGREYYAISNEFRIKDANPWVKENVIAKLPPRIINITPDISGDPMRMYFEKNELYKTNKQIKQEIFEFVCPYAKASEYADMGSIDEGAIGYLQKHPPEFYAYYAAYDWVLLCSLFGTMMQLPTGFPMYCRDLKQMVDDWCIKATPDFKKHNGDQFGFEAILQSLKDHIDYPEQTNEHNALADAKWNFELYKFITS